MKLNQLKVGATLSYVSMGIGYLVSIIYTPIMLRLLGQSEFGLYNLVASVVAYLGILNFGFGSAYMRYYSKFKIIDDKEKIRTLNGMFLIVFSVLGLIAGIAGTLLAINVDIIFGSQLTSSELLTAKILMMILVINIAISFPFMVFTSHITANEKFVFQKLVHLIKTISNPFVVLPILIAGHGSVGMVLGTTILNIAIEITYAAYCLTKLKIKFTFRNFDFKLMGEMSIFSSYIFINLLIDQINWNIGKFLLGRYHGTVAVAIYGIAAQLNTYYISIASTISSVFIPRVHRLVANNNNNELMELFVKIGRIQFIILSLIASGLIFFGKPFINLWAGSNYSDSYLILLLLILPVTVPLIQNIGIEIQRAKNMHQFRSWVYLMIALVNFGITIPLADKFGGVGAALGTAISLLIGNGLIMNWYYHVKVGLDMKYFWKQIIRFIPALIIPVIIGLTMNSLFNLNSVFWFLLCALIYVIIFVLSMWLFGLNLYEKNLIGKPVRKLIGKLRT